MTSGCLERMDGWMVIGCERFSQCLQYGVVLALPREVLKPEGMFIVLERSGIDLETQFVWLFIFAVI